MAADTYSRQAVRASLAHFLVGRSLGVVLAFALLMLLVRQLSPADYGAYITLLSLLEVVQIASSCGLILAAQRYLPEWRSARPASALKRLLLGLLFARAATLAAAALLCLPLVDRIVGSFGLDGAGDAVRLYLLVVFFEGMARFVEVCQDALLRQKASQAALLTRTALRLLLLLAVAASHPGSPVALFVWLQIDLAASVAGCLFGVWNITRFARQLPAASGERTDVERADHDTHETGAAMRQRMLHYVLPGFGAQLLYTSWGPDAVKLVAARLVGALQLAPFGFAAAFASMLQRYLPTFLLLNLIRPLFVAARGRDDFRTRLPFMAVLMFKLNLFALAPLLGFVVVTHTALATLLTGGRLPAAGVFMLFFLAVLVLQSLRGVLSLVGQAMEIGRTTLLGTLIGSLGLLCGIALSGSLGVQGLCLGLVISEALWCGTTLVALHRRQLRFDFQPRSLLRIGLCAALGTACAAVALQLLQAQPLEWQVVAAGAACVSSYLVACRVVRPFLGPERALINGILHRNVFCW